MGGSEAIDWLDGLGASFSAALARDEELAAADLAFSLRQDVDVHAAVARSRCGWVAAGAGGSTHRVEEVGVDYVLAGTLVLRTRAAVLRSDAGPPPRTTDRTFLELLGAACRANADVAVEGASGRLVRVAKDHVAVRKAGVETIVGLDALDWVRLPGRPGYSASRGFSG